MNAIDGGVTAPKGFQASGVAAGVKAGSTKKDCALIVSDVPASVGGMFTTNVMISPPAERNRGICAHGHARAVFINSGNANAATGIRGREDVLITAESVAAKLEIEAHDVCICSTGVIGVPLPMDKIETGVCDCVAGLSPEGSSDAAQAILTTDTVPKEFAREVQLSGGTARIGAMAKGSGMISPNMATMICVLTTDASIEHEDLQALLEPAVDQSFHRISIDNDLSTSDTVLILANGASGVDRIEPGSKDYSAFQDALVEICETTAKALVRDGEGATKFVEIVVSGTQTDEDAKTIARSIANSQLCKTAFYGEDPNWGRFACAAGYAGVDFNPESLSIQLGDVTLTENGIVADYLEEDAAAIMKQPEFSIAISVGTGVGRAVFWTSDLSQGYVSINADYRT